MAIINSRTTFYTSNFFLISISNFFTVSSFGCFFLFPLFITSRGGQEKDIGIIMGAFALSSVLCRPWISHMVDKIGRRRSYGLGTAIMSLTPLAYMLFKGELHNYYSSLILVRLVHGVGLAICFTASFTYVADILPEQRLNEGIGMFGATGLIALAAGPFVAEIVIKGAGFDTFFLTSALLGLVGFILQLFLPESFSGGGEESKESFFSILQKERIITVALLAFLFGFGLAASGGFVAPLVEEKGLGFASLYYISYSGAAVITRLLGGRVADRMGEEAIIPYALILTGTGLLMLTFLLGDMVLVTSGLLSGCGHGLLFPCLNAFIIRDEPAAIRGKITGIFTGGIDGGSFVGSIILGYVGQAIGFGGLFFVAGIALFSGLVIYKKRIGKRG